MPGLKSGGGTVGDLPAWAPAFAAGDVRRRVEAQSRDNGKSVTVPRKNGNPSAGPTLAKPAKLRGADRRAEQSGATERKRNGAGTIIAMIDKRPVPTAVAIRLRTQLIRRPDGAFYRHRCILRGARNVAAETSLLSGNGRTGDGQFSP